MKFQVLIFFATGFIVVVSNEIGYRSKADNLYKPRPDGDTLSIVDNQSFELYCQHPTPFKVCVWKWNQQDCTFVNDVQVDLNCPAQMRRVEQDKCVIQVNNFDQTNHQGKWRCLLVITDDEDLAALNRSVSLVPLTTTQVVTKESTVNVNPSQVVDLHCNTSSQVYVPPEGGSILKWRVDGSYSDPSLSNENYDACVDEAYSSKCKVSSTLKFTAPENGNTVVSCLAQQKDTFDQTLNSGEALIEVIANQSDSSALSAGVKAIIGIAVILIVLLIILLILCFLYGWCCFKNRQKKKPQKLEVHDQPQQTSMKEVSVISADAPQPVYSYKPWPIAPVALPPPQDQQLAIMDPWMEASHDEILVYKWEGFGRPHSTASSLSSLKSFGHVDDLDLNKELLRLGQKELEPSSSSSDDSLSSESADYDIQMSESWV